MPIYKTYGIKYQFKLYYYLNKDIRLKGWKPDKEIVKKTEKLLKDD